MILRRTGLMLAMGVVLASSAPLSNAARWWHRCEPPCLCPPWHRLDEEDVGGLRLVGAWPSDVRLVGAGLDGLTLPRRHIK